MSERFFDWVLKYPIPILVWFGVVVLTLALGLPRLSISNDFRIYFSEDNPQLLAFEAFEQEFTPSDNATLIVEARQGHLFTPRGLALIEELTEAAWEIPYTQRVFSLQNFPYVSATETELRTSELYSEAHSLSAEERELVRHRALSEDRLRGRLVSADGKLSVVLAVLDLDPAAQNASIEVARYVRQLRARIQPDYPEFQIHVGGSAVVNASLAEGVAGDLASLVPVSYVVIFTGLLLFLRSLMGTVAIFIMVSACLLGTFGFFGFIAPVLTPVSGFVPGVLLSIMVADSVHILTSFFHSYHSGHCQARSHSPEPAH